MTTYDLDLARKILDQQPQNMSQTTSTPPTAPPPAPQITPQDNFSQIAEARKLREAGIYPTGQPQIPSWSGEVAPAAVQAVKAKTYDILSVPERWTGTDITGARGLKDYYERMTARNLNNLTPAQQTAVKVAETAQDLAIKAPLFAGVGKLAEPVAGAVAGTAGKLVGKLLPRVAPAVTRIGTHALKTGLEMGTVDAATTPEAPLQAFKQGFKGGAELGAAGEVFAPLTRLMENRPLAQRAARGAVGAATMGGLTAGGVAIDAARQGKDLGQALEEAAPDIAAQAVTGMVMEGGLQKTDRGIRNDWIRERSGELRKLGLAPDRAELGGVYDKARKAGSAEAMNAGLAQYGRKLVLRKQFEGSDQRLTEDADGRLAPYAPKPDGGAAGRPALPQRGMYRLNDPENKNAHGLVIEFDGDNQWVARPGRASMFERMLTGNEDSAPQGYDLHFTETDPETGTPVETWGIGDNIWQQRGNETPRRLDGEESKRLRDTLEERENARREIATSEPFIEGDGDPPQATERPRNATTPAAQTHETKPNGLNYQETPDGVRTWTTDEGDGLPFVRRRYPDGRWTNVENGVEQAIPTYQWPQFDDVYGVEPRHETQSPTPAIAAGDDATKSTSAGMGTPQATAEMQLHEPVPTEEKTSGNIDENPTKPGVPISAPAEADAEVAAFEKPSDPTPAPGTNPLIQPARLAPEKQELFDTLSAALGHRVAAVERADGKPLGFNGTLDESGNLLVAADHDDPVLVVATHEAVHAMKRSDPDLYKQVEDTFSELRGQDGQIDEAAYRQFVAERNRWRVQRGMKPIGEEEFMAHLGGDFAMEPAFWQRLLARSPEAFHRLAGRLLNLYDRILTALTGQAHQPWAKDQILKTVQARETMREAIAEALGEHARRQRGEATAGNAESGMRNAELNVPEPEGKARQGKAAAPVAGLGDMNGTLAERLARLGGLSAELASEMQKKGALDGLSAAKRRKLAPTLYGEAPGPVGLDEIRQNLSDIPELGMSGVELDFDGLPGKDATLDWLNEQMHEKLQTGKYYQESEARRDREQESEWEREYQREQERLAAMTPEERAAYLEDRPWLREDAPLSVGEPTGDELPFMQRREQGEEPERGELKVGPEQILRSNYLVPMDQLTRRAFHETDARTAMAFLNPNSQDTQIRDLYFSNNADLALGQGGRGVTLEIDPAAVPQAKINTAKPTWNLSLERGDAEMIARDIAPSDLVGSVLAVRIDPKALGSRLERAIANNIVNTLEGQGWTRRGDPDSVILTRPEEIPSQTSRATDQGAEGPFMQRRQEAAEDFFGMSRDEAERGRQEAPKTAEYSSTEAQPEKREAAAEPALEAGWRKRLLQRKRTSAGDYLSELIDYGGEPTRRGDVIADLRRQGLSDRQIDAYMMGVGARDKNKPSPPAATDEELPFMERRKQENRPSQRAFPERLREREDETIPIVRAMKDVTLRRKEAIDQVMAAHQNGKIPVHLDSAGVDYAISKRRLYKMTAELGEDGKPKPYQRERIAAIQSLDELARVAVEGDSRPGKGRDPNVEKIREFFAPFQFGQEVFRVRLLAKEFKPEAKLPNPLHSLAIEDVILEKVPADREASGGVEHLLDKEIGRAGNEAGEATAHAEGSTLSIGQLFGLGKGKSKPDREEAFMERRADTRAEDERRTLKADLAKAATKGGARTGDVDRLSRADQQAGAERRTAELLEQARSGVEKDSGKPYGIKTSNMVLSFNPALGYGIVDKSTGKRVGKDHYDSREDAEADLFRMRHPKTVYQAVKESGRRGRAKGWEARGDYDTATMNSALAKAIGAALPEPPETFKKSMNMLIDTIKKLGRQEVINSAKPTESVLKQVLVHIAEAHKGEPEKWLSALDDMNSELAHAEEIITDAPAGSQVRAEAAHDMLQGWMPEEYEAALLAGSGGNAELVFRKLRGLLDEEMKKASGAAMVKVFSRVDPLKLHDADLRGQWAKLVEKSGLGALDALARKLKDQKGAFKKFKEEKNPTPEEIKAREEEIEATREKMRRAAREVKAQDARQVLNQFREIEASSDLAKEIIIDGRRIERAGLAEAARVESEAARDPLAKNLKTGENPRRMGFIRDKMVRWFTAENLALYLAGGKEDGILPTLLRKVRADSSAAKDDHAAINTALTEALKELGVKDTDIVDWKGIQKDYTFQGSTFKFTDAQLMSLYLLMRDPKAKGILVRNGIKPIAKRGLTRRVKDLIKVFDEDGRPDPTATETEINRLTDHLSETQKQAALAMARIKNEYTATAGNAMSRKVFGYEKFLNDNHWRLKVDTADKGLTAADPDKLGQGRTQAEMITNADWLSERVQHKHQVLIEDAFSAFDEQVKKVTTFTRMALSVTDLLATLKNDAVAGELSTRFGTETVGMLRDMVLREAGLIDPPAPGAIKRAVHQLYRGYAISTLGFRPSSIGVNWLSGSIMMAAELAKIVPDAGGQLLNTLRIMRPFAYRSGDGKRIYKLLMQNGYFRERWAGDSAYTFAGSAVDREAFTGRGKLLKRKLENFSLSGMAAAEINNAIGAFKVLKSAGFDDAKALETVELLTRRTQNASTALEDTTWGAELRENGFSLMFPFMNQTFVQANVLARDMIRFKGATRRGESNDKAWSDITHTARGYAASALMGAGIGLTLALMRKDAWLGEDEKKRKARADAIWNGVARAAGEIADDVAPGASNILDPLIKGGIDQIRDEDGKPRLDVLEKTIADLMRQGSSSPVTQMTATGLEAARQTVSMASKGYEPWKLQRVTANTIRLTSQLFALPIGGIEQGSAAIYGLATGRQYGRKEK